MLTNLLSAIDFCRNAHNSIKQVRKYSGENYFDTHCLPVAFLGASIGLEINTVIGLLGHDILEDVSIKNPKYSIDFLRANLGDKAVNIIIELTDEYTSEKYPQLNREHRKEYERARFAGISNQGKTAKICDLIHNTKDIIHQDPKFAVTYIKEKELLLPLLKVSGMLANETVYELAYQQIKDYSRSLFDKWFDERRPLN